MNGDKLFVDTWAWYAMANRKDKDHKQAKALNQYFVDQGYQYFTTNFIFAETYTLLLIRGKSHQAAVNFGENLKQMTRLGTINFIRVTEDLEDDGWAIAKKYSDKDFSYVDCTSFAVMRKFGITLCFTDDTHFAQIGFQTSRSINLN